MAAFLQPPLIHLGFYWEQPPFEAMFTALALWLLDEGYSPGPTAVARRMSKGGAPAAPCGVPCADGRPISADIRSFDNWTVALLREQTEWQPLTLELVPGSATQQRLELAYVMRSGIADRNVDWPIEIVTSGAELDLLVNRGADRLARDTVEAAEMTARWEAEMFESVCRTFDPWYAGRTWEWDLPSPTELLSSDDYSDFDGLYLSSRLIDSDSVQLALSGVSGWRIETLATGVQVSCSAGRGASEASRGMTALKRLLEPRMYGSLDGAM